MPDERILIVRIPGEGERAAFQPDLANAVPGQPLAVNPGDQVIWKNGTGEPHWPWPLDANESLMKEETARKDRKYLTNEIAPAHVSTPRYIVPAGPMTIVYGCRRHGEDARERGRIVIGP
jgi:hypothetical protein